MKTSHINTKKIILTGTHLTPALELINQLKNDSSLQWDIYYVGRKNNSSINNSPSIESQIIPKLNIRFFPINCGKLDRRWFPNTIKGIPETLRGLIDAYKIVNQIKPDIVVSFGGYVSVPIIITSWLNKIPSITHEQTLTNSLTTKINSIFVNKVALTFDSLKQKQNLPKNKIVITGNLLRSEIYDQSSTFFKNLKLKKPIIYITAGNQGSHTINNTIQKLIAQLKEFSIIHQTGKDDYIEFKKLSKQYLNYHVFDYINTKDIGWVLNNSEIIISRSGANTAQEIVALKKASILIPLPKSQQNEQILNAIWVKNKLPLSTIIINNFELTPKILKNSINKIKPLKTNTKFSQQPEKNYKLLNLLHEIA